MPSPVYVQPIPKTYLDTDTALTANSDVKVPSQKAVKAYADTKAPALGADDNYVTDAEKTKLANLSGTNTGDQTLPVKASGAEVTTGTDDAKFVTAKALADAGVGAGGGSFNISVADVTFSGITSTLTAGEALVLGDVCYLKSDGKMWKADADAIATASATAIALATISANATGSFGMHGYLRNDTAYAWTVGGLLYLSTTAGAITKTAPSGTDDVVQILGQAYTADIIYFNPQLVQVEIV